MRNLNEILKNLRMKKNLTQNDLGRYLILSTTGYRNKENGNRKFTEDELVKLADFYQVSLDYLLGRTKKKSIFIDQETLTKDEIKKLFGDDVIFFENFAKVPVLGSVSAGLPELQNEDEIDEYEIAVLPNYGNKKDFFYLKIHGDSMEPALYENDYALVYSTKDVKNNDIVVIGLNGNEALVKRYQCYENGDCWLIADNPKYQPLKLEENHQPYIIGKVIESKKKF